MQPNEINQRKSDRRGLRVPGKLLLQGTGRPLDVRTRDLSSEGMGVVSHLNLKPHQHCTVEFSLPLIPKRVNVGPVEAVISYTVCSSTVDGFLVGLKFLSVRDDDMNLIRAYLDPRR